MSTPDAQPGVVAILLAAGSGTRFDASGKRNKLLASIDGEPIAVLAARNLLDADLPVLAVTRPAQPALTTALAAAGCEVTECAEAHMGMGHSLANGVKAILARCQPSAILVALGDMPFISSKLIRTVASQVSEQHTIVAACNQDGRRGHPVAFWHVHFATLSALQGDRGAGEIIRQAAPLLIQHSDNSVLQDIDQPDDLPGNLPGD